MKYIPALFLFAGLPLAGFGDGDPARSRLLAIDASKFPSLQAALDALPPSGGVVHLPPGELELKEPLVLSHGDTRLVGAGDATRLINRNEEGKPALVVRAAEYPKNKKARLWRVQLANFRISGNPKSGDGILAEGIDEIFLHGLSVDRNGGCGVHFVDCYENPRIAHCNITYNADDGLRLSGCHDIIVNANQFEENLDAVVCVNSFNLTLNGNNIDDHLRHGIVIENTYGSVLSGNMIEECSGIAIVLDRDCYGITISANVIAHHLGGGVDLRDAWGCAVSANTFTLVHTNSIVVGPDSGRITITGNNFCNSYIGGGKDRRPREHKEPMRQDAGTGVLLKGTSDVVVSGNTFSGLDGPAVWTEGDSRRVLISNNLVTDVNRRQRERRPAMDLGGAKESLLKDNIIVADGP